MSEHSAREDAPSAPPPPTLWGEMGGRLWPLHWVGRTLCSLAGPVSLNAAIVVCWDTGGHVELEDDAIHAAGVELLRIERLGFTNTRIGWEKAPEGGQNGRHSSRQ